MTIRLGDGQEFVFSGPDLLSTVRLPAIQGIYTILSKPNPSTQPDSYRVLYIGQTSDFSGRGFPEGHHAYDRWLSNAGSKNNIYISLLSTPMLSETQRKKIETQLITDYNPVCNKSD